jgi:hypothetical protein
LRDLRDMPFIWFQRSANPTFDDLLTQEGARGGLSAPRIVQEATDRDTVLGLVQYEMGIAWLTESIRWHCPRCIVLLPVVDMRVRAFASEICGAGTSDKNNPAKLNRVIQDKKQRAYGAGFYWFTSAAIWAAVKRALKWRPRPRLAGRDARLSQRQGRRIRRSPGTCEQQQPGAVRIRAKTTTVGDFWVTKLRSPVRILRRLGATKLGSGL